MNADANQDRVFAKTDWQCFYCQSDATTIDHMIPVSRGGSDDLVNLVGACERCNHEKGDMSIDEYIIFLSEYGSGKCNREKNRARNSAIVRLNRSVQTDRSANLNPIVIPDLSGVNAGTEALIAEECKNGQPTYLHGFPPL